jgi:hypothetical protein
MFISTSWLLKLLPFFIDHGKKSKPDVLKIAKTTLENKLKFEKCFLINSH